MRDVGASGTRRPVKPQIGPRHVPTRRPSLLCCPRRDSQCGWNGRHGLRGVLWTTRAHVCMMRPTEGWWELRGSSAGTASQHGRLFVPDANGETDPGRWRYWPMARRRMTRLGVAVSAAAVVLSLGASAVFAGEITGNGRSLEPLHGASICAYSGLNDDPEGLDPENGPPGRVQSYGYSAVREGFKAFAPSPGVACNPTKGFEE